MMVLIGYPKPFLRENEIDFGYINVLQLILPLKSNFFLRVFLFDKNSL